MSHRVWNKHLALNSRAVPFDAGATVLWKKKKRTSNANPPIPFTRMQVNSPRMQVTGTRGNDNAWVKKLILQF